MNISMLLVSGILVFCTVIPFVILNKSGKGDIKKMHKEVKTIVGQMNLKFDLKENWGNSFIGLDQIHKTLVFSKVFNGVVAMNQIDLNEVSAVKIVKKTKLLKTKNKRETVLQKLDLELSFYDESKEHKMLGFYDVNDIYIEDYELKRAEKWYTAINGVVSSALKNANVA